jgi:hypothetical protein
VRCGEELFDERRSLENVLRCWVSKRVWKKNDASIIILYISSSSKKIKRLF